MNYDDTGYVLLPRTLHKLIPAIASGSTKTEFGITAFGQLIATNADITGDIQCNYGEIGG
jgi:hypothetical protein